MKNRLIFVLLAVGLFLSVGRVVAQNKIEAGDNKAVVETIRQEERGQVLGVAVENEMATIKLFGSVSQQREVYSFLYGFLQSLRDSQGERFLETQKAPLLLTAENPDFEETIAVIKEGKCDLPDEDIAALHLQLWARWQSLADKTDLFPPEKVFS